MKLIRKEKQRKKPWSIGLSVFLIYFLNKRTVRWEYINYKNKRDNINNCRKGRTPTLQLAWGDIKLLPPHPVTIWWKLYFQELRSKKNSPRSNMMGLKLQAKWGPQSAHIPQSRRYNRRRPWMHNIQENNWAYPSLTKFQATCARAFWATLNFFIASTRGLYGCSTFRSKARVASTTLSPSKINSFCCSYTSCIMHAIQSID